MQLLVKLCRRCGEEKPVEQFPLRSRKSGKLKPNCKLCHAEESRRYCKENPEKRSASQRRYMENTPGAKEAKKQRTYKYRREQSEKYQAARSAYYQHNIEKIKQVNAQWKRDHPEATAAILAKSKKKHSSRVNAAVMARVVRKKQALPQWANLEEIEKIYETAKVMTTNTGIRHEVDHIVPLTSDIVCGLHCEANLRVITKTENIRKLNHWWPDMP